jgi:PTS system mannose-specific IIB component
VYSTDEVIDQWNKDQFGKDKVILLFKTITNAKKIIEANIPVPGLNIGGIAKKNDAKFIIPSVGLTKADGMLLKELGNIDVEVYFQTVPDTKKVSLDEALRQL